MAPEGVRPCLQARVRYRCGLTRREGKGLVVRGLGGDKIFDLTDPLPSRLHCVAGSALRCDLKGGLERRIGIKLLLCLVPLCPLKGGTY